MQALELLLNPDLDKTTALNIAFYVTVLDLFDFKYSVDLNSVAHLFREDFKVYLINTKLKHLGGCPLINAEDPAT